MGRYQYTHYDKATTPRWIVLWGLQWQLLESQRLEPASDLSDAMDAAIQRLAGEGWEAEDEPRFGFVFVRRDGERRLLTLTPRDPTNTTQQSFDPFKSRV